MADDRIQVNLVLNEASVASVEGRVRNIVNNLNNQPISLNIDGQNINNIISNLNTIYQQMQRLNNSSVNINANLTTQQQQYRLETERIRVAQQISVERERTLQTENRAIRALAEENRTMTINRNLTSDINGNIQHTHEHIRNVNNATNDFATGLGRSLQYILQYRIITEMLNKITEAYRELKAVDSSMVGYRKVTGASKTEVKSLTKEAFANASKYGRLASEYAESTERFAKAGYNDKSSELSELALLAENVGDIGNALANEFIVSSDAAWKLNGNITELTKILNMFNELSNKTATDVSKLASGITVSGSMFAQAKLSAQDYAAIIGTATSKTMRSGEEMSRAWRTIIMNLSQIKGTDIETGEIIDEDNLAKAEKTLNAVGIQIREIVNGQNELRNPMNVLKEIADKWHSLSSIQQSALAESISNKRQSNAFISVIENWKDVEKAIEITSESSNSAIRENEIYMDSWAAKQKKVSAEWSEFISHMSNVEIIKWTLDTLASAINVIDTPLGRIVTQIVLINTALAVSNRLWGVVRSRSIVADILSMGLAEGSLGTAIQLVTGHLWEQAAAWLATPMGMATTTSAGIFLLTSAIAKYNEKLEDSRQEMIETGKEAAQLTKDLDGLVEEYRKLGADGKFDNSDREKAYDIQKQINELLGEEVKNINLANGKYEDQLKALKNLQLEKAKEKDYDLETAYTSSKESLLYKADNVGTGAWTTDEEVDAVKKLKSELEGLDKYLHAYEAVGNGDANTAFFKVDTSSAESVVESYEKMIEVKRILEDQYRDEIKSGGALEDFYNNLKDEISDLSDAVTKYKNALADYNLNKAVITFNETEFAGIKGALIESEDSLKIWIINMLASKDVSQDVKNELISLAKTHYPDLSKSIEETTQAYYKNKYATSSSSSEVIEHIKNLDAEADQCGLTRKAYFELITQEILFNNNNLNVNQKISALQQLAYQAGITADKMRQALMFDSLQKAYDTNTYGIEAAYRAGRITKEERDSRKAQILSELNASLYEGYKWEEENKVGELPPHTPSGDKDDSSSAPDKPVYQKFTPEEFEEDNSYSDLYDELLDEKKTAIYKLSSEYDSLNAQLDNALLKGNFDEVNILRERIKQNQDEYQKLLTENANEARSDLSVIMGKIIAIAPEFAGMKFEDIQEGQFAEVQNRLKQDIENQKRIAHELEQANEKAKVDLENAWADKSYQLKSANGNKETEQYKAAEQEYKQKKEELEAEDTSNSKAIKEAELRLEMYEQLYDTGKNYYETINGWSSDWWEKENRDLEERNNQLNDALSQMERHVDKIKEGIQDQIDSVEELKEEKQEQIDGLDDEIAKENGILSIMQKQFDVQNALSDARYEAVKAIATSRVAYEYLDEETRKSIYNEDDYASEIAKIEEVGSEIDRLTNDFLDDINDAYKKDKIYLIESITAEYERQCQLKERELEILQAEIDLQKKQDQLNNVLAEKNVRLLKDGQWTWTHDVDAARQAAEELAEAEYQVKQLETQQEQDFLLRDQELKADALKNQQGYYEKQIEAYDKQIEAYNNQIEMLDEKTEKLSKAIEKITEPLADVESLVGQFADVGVKGINSAVNDLLDVFSKVTNKSYNKVSSKNLPSGIKTTYTADEIIAGKHLTGYASGTSNASKGLHRINEIKDEALITNDGTLIPMANFSGGETVFNHQQVENLWDWSKFSPIPFNINTPTLPDFVPRERESVNSGQNFYGDIIVNEPVDFNGFMDDLNTQIKMIAPITNRMKI